MKLDKFMKQYVFSILYIFFNCYSLKLEYMNQSYFPDRSYNSIPTETFDSAQDGADEYRKISSSLEKYSETMSDLMEKGVEPTELCEV